MTAETGTGHLIVTIDLRGIDPATVTGRRFSEVQADMAAGADGQVDFRRVILLDHVEELTEHDEVYAHILDSHIDVSMLCLAIGPPSAEEPTVAIRRPYQLGPPKAAILWIGDVRGIGWRMDSTLAERVNLKSGQQGGDAALRELIEILSLPQVFDRAIELAGAMRGAAASPGLRVVRGDVTADILADAQRSAIRQLTNPGSHAIDLPPTDGTGGRSAKGQRTSRTSDVIRPGGRIDELYQQSRRAGHDALAIVRRLTAASGLARDAGPSARRALREFADTLAKFTDLVTWLLDEADTRSGLESSHRQQLDELGIELGAAPSESSADTMQALTEQTLAEIDRCQPLPAIAERLRDESDKMVPRGTSEYQARLQRICPPSLFSRLRTPPAVVEGVPPAGVLAGTFVTCLISGAWPKPFGLFCAVALLGTVAVTARVIALAASITSLARSAVWRFLAGQLAAAATGAGCGVALSKVITAAPGGAAGVAAGAGVTVVLLVALAGFCWRVLGGRWSANMQVSRLVNTPDLVRGLVADVARSEWQVAAARTTASDLARVMAGMVDDAAVTLRSFGDSLPAGGQGTASGRQRSDRDQVSRELVIIDLAAAIGTALDRLAASRGPGGLANVDSQAVQQEVAVLLDCYQVHLTTSGLHEPPPFARARERRDILVKSLVERGSDVYEAIQLTIADDRITQLCMPEQLTLLEISADKAELIRFAPRSRQGFMDQQAAAGVLAHPVTWTLASPMAGVLRLVPLRASAVETIMPKAPGSFGPPDNDPWSSWPEGDD